MKKKEAGYTGSLAANQGLYNGFLTAGIIWGMIYDDCSAITFFLACIIVAGVFGALTASLKILFVQSFPAIIAIILIQLGYKDTGDWSYNGHPVYIFLYVLAACVVTAILGQFVAVREKPYKKAAKAGTPFPDETPDDNKQQLAPSSEAGSSP